MVMPSAGIGMILSTMLGSIFQREAYLDLGGYDTLGESQSGL